MTRQIDARLAELGLSRETRYDLPGGQLIPWRLSPEPFILVEEQALAMSRFGYLLAKFYYAADRIYQLSCRDKGIGFVADYLDAGKPADIISYGRHPRFKGQLPLVLRPDLFWTESGYMATEFDSVPGGVGLLSGMESVYADLGFRVADTLGAFHTALASRHRSGAIAIVVSEESEAYRPEMTYVAASITSEKTPVFCLRPEELKIDASGVHYGQYRVGTVYRFFELFDLDNVSGGRSLLDAAANGLVGMTPPPKAYLEEKLWFSLLRHHALRTHWESIMGKASYVDLLRHIPETHILDNRPIPPHAIIPGVTVNGQAVSSFVELVGLPRNERQYVVKPSGFSADAWGSKGIKLGRDLSTKEWGDVVTQALYCFPDHPQVLQRYHYSLLENASYFDFAADEVISFAAKIRYCPFYFALRGRKVEHGGVLVTACPAEKPLIHGMTEAVMVPAALD